MKPTHRASTVQWSDDGLDRRIYDLSPAYTQRQQIYIYYTRQICLCICGILMVGLSRLFHRTRSQDGHAMVGSPLRCRTYTMDMKFMAFGFSIDCRPGIRNKKSSSRNPILAPPLPSITTTLHRGIDGGGRRPSDPIKIKQTCKMEIYDCGDWNIYNIDLLNEIAPILEWNKNWKILEVEYTSNVNVISGPRSLQVVCCTVLRYHHRYLPSIGY